MTTEADIASVKEIGEMKEAVEAKLAEAQKAVFLRYLDPKGGYLSLAETIVGVGLDFVVPGSSTVKDLIKQHGEEKEKQKLRWQDFILSARGITSGT